MYIPIRKLDPVSNPRPQFDQLLQHFQQKFKSQPRFLVTVPGRVNLIGEHVDYSGFAVLPMAIQKHIFVAVGFQPLPIQNGDHQMPEELAFAKVHLTNVQQDQYDSFTFSNEHQQHLQSVQSPKWYHYFMCGYKGVLEQLHVEQQQQFHQEMNNNKSSLAQLISNTALNVAVLGDIPPSSGLSSSSALVCAAAIAITHAIDLLKPNEKLTKSIDKLKMASDCALFERYIGTQGGGMDQAIALLAESGSAKLIEFYPQLACQSVPLPNDCDFFVAHCGQTLNKAATGHYNRRVLETRAAASLLKRHLNKMNHFEHQCVTLGQVMRQSGKNFEQMIRLVHQVLPPQRVYSCQQLLEVLQVNSIEELANLIEIPVQRIRQVMNQDIAGDLVTDQNNEFRLHERALHVYEEASRVYRVQQLSSTNDLDDQRKLIEISQLMDDSHQSCRHLFECSSERLDNLVRKSKQAGALGSRLTGAGWGGCIVSLVPIEKTDEYLESISKYSRFVFKTCPGEGAVIYHLC